jgi:hypothetical protein
MFTLAGYREILLNKFGGLYLMTEARNLPPGSSPQNWDVDFQIAGVGTRPGLSDPVTSFTPTLAAYPVEYLKSTQVLGPLNLTLMEDGGTTLYHENLNDPGIFTSFYSPILNNARALSETVNSREYIALSNFAQGTDQPRQYDGVNLDRISQVGPGQGPSMTVASANYPISAITEIYSTHNITTLVWGSALNTTNAPPPSANLYFMGAGGDTAFASDLSIGVLVYVTGIGLLEGQNPNGTYAVTSIGQFADSNGTHQYFGVTAYVANSDFVRGTSTIGTYQRTQALIQLTNPIPQQDAVVGATITVQGASVAQWNTPWKIAETPTEGQLSISATSLSTDVATYDYVLQSGEAPGWQPDFIYPMAAQIVDPNAGDGTVWQVTTPGTSGGSIPGFGSSPQTDNTVVWTKQASGTTVLATVFNTTNGNGIFNVANQQVLLANSTSFTVAITSPDIGSASEDGQAVTGSGTALIIDPGTITLGTGTPGTNPIYGNATGGDVLVPTNSFVAAGQRWAVTLFLTRDGYITPASPPVSFYTNGGSGYVTPFNLAVGPPNVIARIVAITLANAGVGGPYFWVPDDVVVLGSVAALGVTTTFNKTVLDDNVQTSFPNPINLSDAVIAASENISVAGNNLQQQRELGECVKVVQWAGRCFYLGERTKNDQFVNLTFDGGHLALLPTGWTISSSLATYVSLIYSQVFGESLFINNTSGSTINSVGTVLASIASLSQVAYEVPNLNSPIVQPNTAYSIRVTAANSAGLASGFLVIEFYSPSATVYDFTLTAAANASGGDTVYSGTITGGASNAFAGLYFTVSGFATNPGNNIVNALCVASTALTLTLVNPNGVAESNPATAVSAGWQAVIPMSSMPTTLQEFIVPLNNPLWDAVPADLLLRVYPLNLANLDNVTVDRIEVFAANQPVYTLQVAASYAENTEAIDGVTGAIDTSILSSQPQTNHFVFINKYFITTKSRTFSPIQSASGEPDSWVVDEISNAVGSLGPLANFVGEEYMGVADQNGVYIFDGGNHIKISQEIQPIWDARYKPSDSTVWMLNDLDNQRILVGLPLPTPNQWLPNAPLNAAPTTPNVILMCRYLGMMTGAEIANGHAIYPSAFTGMLLFHDMKRKWSPWQIPAACASLIERSDGSEEVWFGQGEPPELSISPTNVIPGSGNFNLTVTGSNFTSSMVVYWNTTPLFTVYDSPSQLTGEVPASYVADSGTAEISIYNPDTGYWSCPAATLSISCEGGVPAISTLTPSSVLAGIAVNFTVLVTGSNFFPSSVVEVGGSPRVTTYVSSTQLLVTILSTDVASAATLELTVYNPPPGCGGSSESPFTVNAATETFQITALFDFPQQNQTLSYTGNAINGAYKYTVTVSFLDGYTGTVTLSWPDWSAVFPATVEGGFGSLAYPAAGEGAIYSTTSTSLWMRAACNFAPSAFPSIYLPTLKGTDLASNTHSISIPVPFGQLSINPTLSAQSLGVGDGGTKTFTGSLASTPVSAGSIQVISGTVYAHDDGSGHIVGTGVTAGTINYTTGSISVTYAVAPTLGTQVIGIYQAVGEYQAWGGFNFDPEFNIGSVPMGRASWPIYTLPGYYMTTLVLEIKCYIITAPSLGLSIFELVQDSGAGTLTCAPDSGSIISAGCGYEPITVTATCQSWPQKFTFHFVITSLLDGSSYSGGQFKAEFFGP